MTDKEKISMELQNLKETSDKGEIKSFFCVVIREDSFPKDVASVTVVGKETFGDEFDRFINVDQLEMIIYRLKDIVEVLGWDFYKKDRGQV